jgi:YidC/Oxa1 family membrane protein insertase
VDNVRLIIIAALCFVGLQLYLAWQLDYGQQAQNRTAVSSEPDANTAAPETPSIPSASREGPPPRQLINDAPLPAAESTTVPIRVITDVLDLTINPVGGVLDRAALRNYAVAVSTPSEPFVLVDRSGQDAFFIQSGLMADGNAPDHRAVFETERTEYSLDNQQNDLSVTLRWKNESGLRVEKIFSFARGSYVISISYVIHNTTSATWSARPYVQAQRRDISSRGPVRSFNGVALSSKADRYKKYDLSELKSADIDEQIDQGWAALIQHYFVVALLPTDTDTHRYYSKVLDDDHYLIGSIAPAKTVAPNASAEMNSRIYVGPKLQHLLPEVAEGLALTVDYGVFWPIAKPLFWILEQVQSVLGNWGWSIVIVTILLKILFYPLQDRAYRSMARMRKLQPRMQAIKDRYGDDPQRMRTAMADLYRTEKFNPLGGCLPTLLQIPVFISLYWVLLESVEMRQASFVLWLNDLSSPDRYFVLPALMGITMYFSQKMNPSPVDPVQAKVMQILPIAFTLFYVFLPSGLVLYWTVQSFLSLIQQYLVTRQAEADPA